MSVPHRRGPTRGRRRKKGVGDRRFCDFWAGFFFWRPPPLSRTRGGGGVRRLVPTSESSPESGSGTRCDTVIGSTESGDPGRLPVKATDGSPVRRPSPNLFSFLRVDTPNSHLPPGLRLLTRWVPPPLTSRRWRQGDVGAGRGGWVTERLRVSLGEESPGQHKGDERNQTLVPPPSGSGLPGSCPDFRVPPFPRVPLLQPLGPTPEVHVDTYLLSLTGHEVAGPTGPVSTSTPEKRTSNPPRLTVYKGVIFPPRSRHTHTERPRSRAPSNPVPDREVVSGGGWDSGCQ